MADSRASAVWHGDLLSGEGTVTVDSGAFPAQPVTWKARTERPDSKTSPEELIAAAHAACYAMAFSHTLAEAGHTATELRVSAVCHLKPGVGITTMNLDVSGSVPGLDQSQFEQFARQGEAGCPVSGALRGNVEINLTATLAG
jgi:osmotically inducible protein OsmC